MKRSWLVIGGGVSGLGAAKWLAKKGEAVRVSDGKPLKPETAAAFRALGADVRDGGHTLAHLDGVTDVVLSPGLSPAHELVRAARARGLPMISEIDLALRDYRGRVVGVTGTNGKSTTCAMLGHVLAKAGVRVAVGGNFGDPPTAMLAEGRAGDVLVLELSSYQLEQSELVAPEAAVFTSFSFDHLARHGSLEGYFAAKWRLFQRMPKTATAVLPDYVLQLAEKQGLALPCRGVVVGRDVRVEDLPLAGLGIDEAQNRLNAAFTLVVCEALLGRPAAALAPLLAGFRGLPHRCELVGTFAGRPVINDSKSTNVESTLVALQSQAEPVLLLMGGQGKGEPYAPLLGEKRKIAAVVTFGATGPDIARALRDELPVQEFPTLKAALAAIAGILEGAGPRPVLFSPGCASFDEFQNYEHRGRVFRDGMIDAGMTPL